MTKRHDCNELPPYVEIYEYSTSNAMWPAIWCIEHSMRHTHTGNLLKAQLFDITHCPFCGEKLEES